MVNPEMSWEGEEKSRIDCDRYIPFLRAVKECMERASSSDADSKEQLRSDLQQLERVAKSLPHTPEFDGLVNAMLQLVSSTFCWRCVHAHHVNAHIRTNNGRVPKERPFSVPPVPLGLFRGYVCISPAVTEATSSDNRNIQFL